MPPPAPPTVLISYSWDSPGHKDWVKQVATDLVDNGVQVLLDVWELRLGGDLGRFMERSIAESDRVLMICTDNYVSKADSADTGGVAYEAQIVRSALYGKLDSHKFIPIIRDQVNGPKMPSFMGVRMYSDFRNDAHYAAELEALLRDIHGAPSEKPSLGKNPYNGEE